jgi:hypothetical protein
MALNDIKIYSDGSFGPPGSIKMNVAAGSITGMVPGDIVVKTLGATTVSAIGTNSVARLSVGTDYIVGIAVSTSTQTASAAGSVEVMPNVTGLTYLCAPNSTTAYATQTVYDALVGARVKFSVSTKGVITILATDSTYNGAIVEPLDISKYPGLVRFSLRKALNYNA